MPVIPTFDVSVGVPQPQAPARADPTAFAAPGAALAQGAGQVSTEATDFAARYADARRSADASNIVSQGVQQLGDARFKWSKVADSQAAYAGYQSDAATIKQNLLANVSDPLVQSYVTRSLDPEIISGGLATHDASFALESSARRGDLDTTLLGYRNAIAAAPNPQAATHLNDLATQAIQGARAGGWIAPEEADQRHIQFGSDVAADQAKRMILTNPSAAATVLGDPAKTQQMFPGLTPNMADALAAHADARAYRMEARQREAAALQRADLGQTISDLSYAGLQGQSAPIPEAQIRAAFPGGHGDRIIAGLQVDQQAGALFQGLKFAPPGADQAALDALKMPGALTTNGVRVVDGKIVMPDGGANPNPAPEAPEALRERARAISALQGVMDGQHLQAARDLHTQMGGLREQYLQGATATPVPEADIRAALPADQADRVVQSMNTLRQGGSLLAGVSSATPDQEHAALQTLAVPGTLAGNRLQVQHGQVVPPADGSVVPPATETPEDMSTRTQLLTRLAQAIQQKHAALAADPAGYAAQQEDVASKLQAIDPSKPDTLRAGLSSLLAMQGHLGIPDQDQRVLTNSQVQATIKDWTTSDPATTNIGAKIDQFRQTMGDYAPRAFADLVQVGKLPPQWQVVAAMTEPGQEAGRAELIRTLQAAQGPGGATRLADAVPPDAKKAIDRNLSDEMAPFRGTMAVPGEPNNLDVINGVQDAIRQLAYSKAMAGASGETALTAAADAVLNDKYDFEGALRTPKGLMPQAQELTARVQASLTPADIKPPARGDAGLTPDQNAAVVATAARRNGVWITNRTDDGAMLMVPLRDGSQVPVVRRDGTAVEVKWSDLPPAAPGAGLGGLGDPDTVTGSPPSAPPLPRLRMPLGPDLSHITGGPVGAKVGAWWRGVPPSTGQ